MGRLQNDILFTYFHLAIPDFLATLISFVFLYNSNKLYHSNFKSRGVISITFLGILLISIKISFGFILIVPIIASILIILFNQNQPTDFFKSFKYLLIPYAFFLVIIVTYYFFFQQELSIIREQQSGSFSLKTYSWLNFKTNTKYYVYNITYILCALSWIFLFIWVLKNKISQNKKVFFFFLTSWSLLESCKLGMSYFPERYAIPLLFSLLIFPVFLLLILLENGMFLKTKKQVFQLSIAVFFIVFSIKNLTLKRYYSHENISNYLLNSKPKALIAGAWGPTFTWKLNNQTIPIWENFNTEIFLAKNAPPSLVVSENNNADDGGIFAKNDIVLSHISDSVRVFNYKGFLLNFHWINPVRWKNALNKRRKHKQHS